MIRKAVIAVLTIAAIAAPLAWFLTTVGSFTVRYALRGQDGREISLGGRDGHLDVWFTVISISSDASSSGSTEWGGFTFLQDVQHGYPGRHLKTVGVLCPGWSVFTLSALLAIYPGYVFARGPLRRRYSKRYRREHGLCVECLYNLTGNVSGVCPECGTKIEAP